MMCDKVRFVTVGVITKPHKFSGAVKVLPLTDYPDKLLETQEILLDVENELRLEKINDVYSYGNNIVIKFAKVNSFEDADKLRGVYLKIPTTQLEDLEEGQYYIFDLVGMKVKEENNEVIGELVDVLKTGANDVYVVKDSQGKEILIPAIKSVIKKIDIKEQEITVKLLPGLI